MLGVCLLFVGIVLINNGMCSLYNVDGKSTAIMNIFTGGLSLFINFVNLVQGEGLYGFDSIRRTAELMMEAYREEKDTEKLVVQKGWGCECCL